MRFIMAICLWFLVMANLYANPQINWDKVTGEITGNLPHVVSWYMQNTSVEIGEEYQVYTGINPFLQRVDINADGKCEYAILVERLADRKIGVLIVFDESTGVLLFGGVPINSLSHGRQFDDLRYLRIDMWYVDDKKELEPEIESASPSPPKPYGEQIVIGRMEASMARILWDGHDYVLY